VFDVLTDAGARFGEVGDGEAKRQGQRSKVKGQSGHQQPEIVQKTRPVLP
jgi:hypothetical protein